MIEPDASAPPKRLGERLIESGLITPEALEGALERQKKTGARLGECLVELGLLPEQSMLRFLAAEYRTRYVSADKLARTPIPSEVLDRVPVRMAEQQALIPILHDEETSSLSVVMAEPQNLQVLEEVRLVASVQEVNAYIGLRSAVQAAIRRHYYGDTSAFESLAPPSRADLVPLADFFTAHAAEAKAAAGVDAVEMARVLMGQLDLRRRDMRFHATGVAAATRTLLERMGVGGTELRDASLAAYIHDLGKRSDHHLTLLSIAGSPDLRAEAKRVVRAPSRLLEAAHLPARTQEILASVYEAYDGSGLPSGHTAEETPLAARVIAAVDAYDDLRHNPASPFGRAVAREEALGAMEREAGRLFDPVVVRALAAYHFGELLRQRLGNDAHPLLWIGDGVDPRMIDGLAALGLPVTRAPNAAAARTVLESAAADLVVCSVDAGRAEDFAPVVDLKVALGPVPLVLLGSTSDPSTIQRGLSVGAADWVTLPIDASALGARLLGVISARGIPARAVQGSLDELPLPELLQLLGDQRRSGSLGITWAAGTVDLSFEGGRVVHARAGGATGEKALLLLAEVQRADVRYEPGVKTAQRSLDRSVEQLIAELAARAVARV